MCDYETALYGSFRRTFVESLLHCGVSVDVLERGPSSSIDYRRS